jgi:hypothetical protein
MELTCGATGITDKLQCTGLSTSVCPHQTIEIEGDVDLKAYNPDFFGEYAGCYSPCGILTYTNWGNAYAKYAPTAYPAYEYCCAGPTSTMDTCNAGPVVNDEYTQVVHENCDAYAWAYDDAVGLKACEASTTQYLVQFFDP